MKVFFLLKIFVLSKLFSLSSKFIDLLIFLKMIIIKIPTENSNAAKPIINKLVDNKVKSSLIAPIKTVYVYNVNHVISEYNNNLKKFSIFTTKPINVNQKKKFQKLIQVCKKLSL